MTDYLSTSILEVTKQLVDDYKPVKTRDLGLGSQVASCYLSHSLFGKAFLCKVSGTHPHLGRKKYLARIVYGNKMVCAY